MKLSVFLVGCCKQTLLSRKELTAHLGFSVALKKRGSFMSTGSHKCFLWAVDQPSDWVVGFFFALCHSLAYSG